MDGTSHPLKDDEKLARAKHASIGEKLKKLEEAYANPDNHTREEVSLLQQEVLRPREDITQEVF